MKPISKVYCIDNMKFMPQFEDNFFDLAPVDPPYFSGPEKRNYYGNSTGRSKHSKTGDIQVIKRVRYPITKKWIVPGSDFRDELKRVSKNQIIWGANYYDFIVKPFKTPRGDEINDFIKKHPRGWIIWDKCNGTSSFNDYELAWTSFDIPTTTFKYMWNGMMQGKSIKEGDVQQGNKKLNEKKIHPTQKPIILYKWILNKFAENGSRILDTHMGSQNSRIASFQMGFDYWGCEIDPIHFSNGCNRFNTHTAQQTLF